MAKILKQLVFGQKKNPPAPPMPDYQGEEAAKDEFADHDYENISKFTSEGRSSIRFQEPKEPELVVFENYSEPADLLRDELSVLRHEDESDPVYMAPVDDASQSSWAINEEEDMYCVPYEGSSSSSVAPPLPSPCMGPGYITHKLGRQTTLMFASTSYVISWLTIAYAPSIPVIYAGRLISGLCAGVCCVAVPAYVVEIAPTEIRGLLTSGFQFAFGTGVFLIISLGAVLRWSWLAISGAVITTCAVCLMVMMPESPAWLVRESRTEEAIRSIRFLKGRHSDVMKEIKDIRDNLVQSESNNFSWKEFLDPTFYKPVIITAFLMLFQQVSGVNAVMSYTVEIFNTIGSSVNPQIASSVVAAVQVVATVFGGILMDKTGRKKLYMISGSCMSISFFILGLYSYLTTKTNKTAVDFHLYGWIPLVTLMMYMFAFSLGVGPIPFVMTPEIAPIRFRSMIIAFGSLMASLSAFAVTKSFEKLRELIGFHGLFWLYGSFSLLSAFYGRFFLPETKGLTLHEIHRSFSSPDDQL